MHSFEKKIFITLLTRIINAFNHTKCASLSNQKCISQPNLIILHPNEYIQGFCYYPFAVNLDKCTGSCNTLNELSNKVCIPNETENLNLSIFNMITRIKESKTLTKHFSCKCKCKCDGRKCNSNHQWNKDKCQCQCKNLKEHHVCGEHYI